MEESLSSEKTNPIKLGIPEKIQEPEKVDEVKKKSKKTK